MTQKDFVFPTGSVNFDTYRNDYGAVILDKPVTNVLPLLLPLPGIDDHLDLRKFPPTTVGYGYHGFDATGTPIGGNDREYAKVPQYGKNQNSDAYLLLGNSTASACNGDSGGPAQLGGVVLALTTGGEFPKCDNWAYFARMDIPVAEDFYGPLILGTFPTFSPALPLTAKAVPSFADAGWVSSSIRNSS